MKTYEFGASLENLQTHSKLTKKSLLDFFFLMGFLFFGTNGEKMSLENAQTLSKLKENMCSQLFLIFFWVVECIFFLKKVANAYFFEFGESLEILQTHFFLFFQLFFFEKWYQTKISLWVWSQFGASLSSQRNLCLMSLFTKKWDFSFCFGKTWGKKWVWRISKLSPNSDSKKICVHNFFLSFFAWLNAYFFQKKSCERIFFFEFGESLERSFSPVFSKKKEKSHFFVKNDIKQRFLCEFGVSSEILHFLLKTRPNSYVSKISLWVWSGFGDSPNSLQTRSKLICFHFFVVFLFYFFFWKDEWSWSEFGDSPNPLQTHSKLICFHFFCFIFSILLVFYLRKRNEFGVSLEILQTLSKLICFHFFCYLLFLDKRNEFGVSLEILQTDSKFGPSSYVFSILLFFLKRNEFEVGLEISKLSPNSIQTQMISCFIVLSLYCFFIFVRKRQTTLEWVWRFSKLSPNSLQTHMFSDFSVFFLCFSIYYLFYFFWEKGHEFGVSLGILQTHPKLTWFLFFLCFPFIVILNIFLGREEWVWSKFGGSSNFKLSPNLLQTRSKLIWFHFVVSSLLSTYCFFIFLRKEWIFIFFTGPF